MVNLYGYGGEGNPRPETCLASQEAACATAQAFQCGPVGGIEESEAQIIKMAETTRESVVHECGLASLLRGRKGANLMTRDCPATGGEWCIRKLCTSLSL